MSHTHAESSSAGPEPDEPVNGTLGDEPHDEADRADANGYPDAAGGEREFRIVMRGYDRDAVQAHMDDLEAELEQLRAAVAERDRTLAERDRALAEAPAPERLHDLDDDDLFRVASTEVADLIKSSKQRGAKILDEAQRKATQQVSEAEQASAALEAATAAERQRVLDEADAIRNSASAVRAEARANASKVMEDAQAAADRTRQEAQEAADAVRQEAQAAADRVTHEAQTTADRVTHEADANAQAVRAAAAEVKANGEAEIQRRLAEADDTARMVIEEARATAAEIIAEAQARVEGLATTYEEHRARLMADLSAQRDATLEVLDQLANAKQQFTGAYHAVSQQMDQALNQLSGPVQHAQRFVEQVTHAMNHSVAPGMKSTPEHHVPPVAATSTAAPVEGEVPQPGTEQRGGEEPVSHDPAAEERPAEQ